MAETLATRQQIDANVTNLYSQVGENHIWRTGFQAINSGEIYVLGTDNNLWLEHAPFNSIPPSRTQVDANVETFQAVDLGTVFVLGTDGNLWYETSPFGPNNSLQVDGNAVACQPMFPPEQLIPEQLIPQQQYHPFARAKTLQHQSKLLRPKEKI